jgi:hypothetical protein
MAHEYALYRIGGLSAMTGALITIVAIMLGPLGLDSHNIISVIEYFAANASRLQVHGLAVSIGKLLLLAGFVALYQSLRTGVSGSWARIGIAAAIVTTLINIIGPMVGGSVLPAVSQMFVQASAEESAAALYAAQSIYLFYEALLGPTLISLAAAILPFSIAVIKSENYSGWLGWIAVIVGLWLVVGGVAFFLVGPIDAPSIMNYFIPAFMLTIIWLFIIGVYLMRFSMIVDQSKLKTEQVQTTVAG